MKKVLIVKQILLLSTIGNVWRTMWRICKLILGFKGLMKVSLRKGEHVYARRGCYTRHTLVELGTAKYCEISC